jgi:hypothetical protein
VPAAASSPAKQQQQQHPRPFLALLRGGAPVTTAALDADSDALRVPLPGPLHSLHALRSPGGSTAASTVVVVLESGAVGCAEFARGELEQAEAVEGAALAAASAGEGLAVAVRGSGGGGGGGVAVALYRCASAGGCLRRVPIAVEGEEGEEADGETTPDVEERDEDGQGEAEEEEEQHKRGGGRGRRRRGGAAPAATAATPLSLLHLPAPRRNGTASRSHAAAPSLAGLAYWPGAYVAALWQSGGVTLRPLTAGAGTVTAGPAAELGPGPFFVGAAGAEGAESASGGRKRTKSAAAGGGDGAYALAALGPAHLLLVRVGPSASSPPTLSVRHAVIDARFGVALATGSAELSGVPPTLDLAGSGSVRLLPLLRPASSGSGRGRAVLVLGGQAAFALSFEMPAATLASMVGRLALAGGAGAASGPQGAVVVVAAAAAGAAAAAAAAADLFVPARARPIDVAAVLTPEQRLAAAQDAAPCALRPAAAARGREDEQAEAVGGGAVAAMAAAAAAAEELARAVDAFEASSAASLQGGGKKSAPLAAAAVRDDDDDAAADALEAAARRAAEALASAAEAAATAGPPSSASKARGRHPRHGSASNGTDDNNNNNNNNTDWRLSPRLLGRAAAALAAAKRWPALARLLSAQPPQTLLHCPRLLPALAAARQYDLVALVCASAEDVPAASVVRAMCSVLSAAAAARAAAAAGKKQPQQPQQAAWRARVRACAERAVRQAEAHPSDQSLRLAAWRAAAAVDKPFTAEDVALHALAAAPCDPVELTAALRRRLPSARAALRLVKYLGKWAERHARELPEGCCSGGAEDALLRQQQQQQQQHGQQDAAAARAAFPREADEEGSSDDKSSSSRSSAFGAAGPLPARVLLLSPGYSQVLDLLRAVLDAQLTPLALLGEAAHPALQRLQRTVAGAAARGGAMAKLKGAAEHLAAGAPLPDAAIAAASNYTVELLDLRVAQAPAAAQRGGGQQQRRSSGGGGRR